MSGRTAPLVIAISVATVALAQDEVSLPKDVPPVVGMAVATESHDDRWTGYQIELVVPSIQYEVRRNEYVQGKPVVWDEIITNVSPMKRVLKFETPSQIPDSLIVGIDGVPLSAVSILERLKKRVPVLVSVSGKMVDPYYLQLAKEDVVIILLNRRDGMGDRAFLPRANFKIPSSADPPRRKNPRPSSIVPR